MAQEHQNRHHQIPELRSRQGDVRALERSQREDRAQALRTRKTRASQINGCAYCIDMHTREARHAGETEQRLYALNAWRETPFYTDRERAALEWTEAVTLVSDSHVPDDVFERVSAQFTEPELVALTFG